MRTNFQRVGALLLILAMLLCYMPGMAFADESETAATQAVDTIATGAGDSAVVAVADGNGHKADIQVTGTGTEGDPIEVSIGGTISTSYHNYTNSSENGWWVNLGFIAPATAQDAVQVKCTYSGDVDWDGWTDDIETWTDGGSTYKGITDFYPMVDFTGVTVQLEWLGAGAKSLGVTTYHLTGAKDLELAPFEAEIVDFGYGQTAQDVENGTKGYASLIPGVAAPTGPFEPMTMWFTFSEAIPADATITLTLSTPNGTTPDFVIKNPPGTSHTATFYLQGAHPSVQVGEYKILSAGAEGENVKITIKDDTATVPPLKNAPVVNWKGSGFESKAADVKAAIEAATGENDPSRKITDDMVYAVCQLDWSQVGAPYGSGNTLTYNVIHDGTLINSQPIASSTPGTVFNFTLGGEKDKMAGIYIIEICKDDVAIATQVIDVYAVTYDYQAGKGVQEFADTTVLVGTSKLEAAKNGKLADTPQVELEDDKGQLQWVESGDAADPHHITLVATDGEKAEVERLRKGVENTKITLSSKSNKKGIRLDWKRSNGFKVDYYEVFKSLKRSTGSLGKAAYYKTSTGTRNYYIDTKKLKKGTRYYYRVRGVRALADGTNAYTKWSNWAWRKSPVTRS